MTYDVSTKGGLNATNFADVLDWWGSTLSNLKEFSDAHRADKDQRGDR